MNSKSKESRKPSMMRRAELRPPRAVRALRTPHISTDKLAMEICDEMISNLRFNVGEQKKRFSNKY